MTELSQDTKNEQKILEYIRRVQTDKPPSKRDIHRGTGIKYRKDAYNAVDALLESGAIMSVERNGTGRGRTTTGFIVAEM